MDALRVIVPTAVVIDLYCASTMVAAPKILNIPVYYFVTSGACVFATILHFPTLDRQNQGSFKDMNKSFTCQLKEITKGLELSGHRFLWVIRSQPTIKKEELFVPPDVLDSNTLLPDGFLERTKHRGIVVNKWAQQVAVLNHKSVGGFVTHCGWNSVLEATCFGVPMVAWPLYAEQKINRIVMVEDMKLALPMDEIEGGKVAAAEIEKRIRQLMESEEGNFVREVVKASKEDAARAMSDGGSSCVALAKLVECWDVMRRL
ncbi:glycosyltransferase UGT88A8 [Artemisia annua]|uniref:Glycosyltransferase UGT88A8 n=1 Tax=Artemisia annua TaxID=35608 RepID=A0A2U1M0T1_ARTAN|nr:glycosyltransferase UGT88A8 [Artemisia annua]